MSFYNKKINIYKNAQSAGKPVQENAALLFEGIARKIEDFECLYAAKQFENACHKVNETLTLCEGLSGILIDIPLDPMQADATLDWQIYFIELMRTISSLARDHNPQKKEKLINSLNELAQQWRDMPVVQANIIKTEGSHQKPINMDA
jgi:flagellin-specific chaperone FliS